ncbi:MAG TPA: hypothetical protein VEL31_09185, partial [Ktedonobacteraceae bacterium]|nr:hypothetical protein [Ktedonobacteraceae bacterium]
MTRHFMVAGMPAKSAWLRGHISWQTGFLTCQMTRASDNYKWWVLITAIFGAFVSILDATVVNTALP